jgi:hypothetical protein
VVDGLEGTVNLSASSFLLLGLSSRAMRVIYQELLPWMGLSHMFTMGIALDAISVVRLWRLDKVADRI